VAVGGAQAYMRQVWRGGPEATCRAVVDGRFPFEPNATQDAPIGDFTALLAPNGILDRFFNTHLKPFVDTTQHPWRWRKADNVELGLPDEVLAQFERAAILREALFPTDGGKLGVAFEVEPTKVDERIVSLALDIDGQRLVYRNGPIRRTAMRWPGPENAAGARLSFAPDRGETPTTAAFNGPFGFLRLLESGTALPDDASDTANVRFNVGDRAVTFRFHAATVRNVFGVLPAFAAFRCPTW
jgi:type VI secretion system protein ImpL